MTWRDNHIGSPTGTEKVFLDNGSTAGGAHRLLSEIVGATGTINTGTTGALAFYAANGTTLSPLTLGTNLSLTGTTLNAAGGSGGSTAYGAPTPITASGAQSITLAGATTFIRLTNTSGATALTLPNGTSDGQRALIEVSPTTQAHTLALTFFGASVTLQASSPNGGYSFKGYWCQADTSWYPDATFDGGFKIGDLASVTTLALGDKLATQQASDNVVRNATLTQLQALLLASGGTFGKRVAVAPVAITYASTVAIDASLGNEFRIGALTGAVTVSAPTNLVDGNEITVRFTQDGTGGRAVTLNSIWVLRSGDTIPTTASSVTEVSGRYDSTAGKIRAGVATWAS